MIGSIVTHLAAAILPFVLIYLVKYIRIRQGARREQKEFLGRQKRSGVQKIGLLDEHINILTPPETLDTFWAMESALEVVSLSIKHGVFDLLEKQPGISVDSVAEQVGLSRRYVRAGFELLLAAGHIVKVADGYSVAPQTRVFFSKDSPLYDCALPDPPTDKRILEIIESDLVPQTILKWTGGKAIDSQMWARANHRISFTIGFALSGKGILKDVTKILDVAGGVGSVCIALGLRNPQLDITMIELPEMVKLAKELIDRYDLSARIKCLESHMFQNDWPTNMEAVLFTNIFHDWLDEQCQELAKRAFNSLVPGGKIVLNEALLNEDKPGPLWTAHFSLTMAKSMMGRQFRQKELTGFLEHAGFTQLEVLPLVGYYSSVVGRKPK